MLLHAWRLATRLAAPLVRRHFRKRLAQGREHPERWPERFGLDESLRSPGPLVWLHAASVGESVSILPLLEALRRQRPDLQLLVTTVTVTSAALMAKRLPEGAFHRFAPVDVPAAVTRFLDRWRPDLVLMIESEIWPNILASLAERHVPIVLVNGRMSERSFRCWRLVRASIARLLGSFQLVLAQSSADADRLRTLGARHVVIPGNLKYAALPLPADVSELETLRVALDSGPAWLAASTHPGEEALAGRVHRTLLRAMPNLVTIIVPRHPDRAAEIAAALAADGCVVGRRSAGMPIEAGAVHLADTLGELGLFYRCCPIVFMGGSLVRHGGQNPLEPARLGCAVLLGPHVWNFAEIARDLAAAGGASNVSDEGMLGDEVAALLADPGRRSRMGRAAQEFALERAGVLDRTLDALRPLLPPSS